MEQQLSLRNATPSDAPMIAPFIYGSASQNFDDIFPDALNFLQFAIASQKYDSFWSYRYQRMLFVSTDLASSCTRYEGSQTISLLWGTIKTIFSFYGLFKGSQVVTKSLYYGLYYKPIPKDGLYLANGYTVPKYRGQKLLTLLLDDIASEAKLRKTISKLVLDVDQENQRAQRLYKWIGFKIVGSNTKMIRMESSIM